MKWSSMRIWLSAAASNWPYVQYLKDEIKRQEESNQLKIDYMKKLKNGR